MPSNVDILKRPLTVSSKQSRQQWIALAVLIIAAVFFHLYSDGTFLTSRNLSNLLRQISINLTLAIGMTLVILTGGIDLSVGSMASLCGMTVALGQLDGGWSQMGAMGFLISFAVALGVGSAFGLLNGLLISKFKLAPFIVTLGMMVIARGLTLVISNAQAVAPMGENLIFLSRETISPSISFGLLLAVGLGVLVFQIKDRKGFSAYFSTVLITSFLIYAFSGYRGIPYMSALVALLFGGFYLLITQYRFGRFIYAIGSNKEAAHLAGVPTGKVTLVLYLFMGMLAGVAGLLDISRVNGAVPTSGELAELDAIAAVVIGGTSLTGGQGSLTGTLYGVLLLGVLNNGLSLLGVSEHYQKIFKGVIIVLTVYLDSRQRKD